MLNTELEQAVADGKFLQHWFVRSPFFLRNVKIKTRKQCNWNKEQHGIEWGDGNITIRNVYRQLTSILKNSVVYVKRLVKAIP